MNPFKKISDYFNDFRYQFKLKKEILDSCKTVLDLGCGEQSPIKLFSDKLEYSLGIDNFVPYIERSKNSRIHSDYLISNVFDACRKIKDKSFDCVVALDLIEHLDKTDGLKLIKEAERIAKKRVIIFTPNGFLKQETFDGNTGQVHLSGYSVKEMRNMGYLVFGISGLKFLRREKGDIKFWPAVFWKKAASLTQLMAYYWPEIAFQILCIKNVEQTCSDGFFK
ncbi:MAG: methyltransferase domain-containing protein [Patescibacteria group bacterium]|nr:methyltransferase domain-containing protein [Patescibacteria group bacterium]MDD5121336.1 methyltransferase domain-containing protein [Patescibacteria group bacterium]MDD5221821.1 methyltransferase domain-containing protein [Patescibacteria group bacterium]MDD5395745.1 methyltransferase domain-containing protein [Patescibacteria group bacterium]